ncbi:bifunctional diguanylate cyclase/phosphodiesterase [Undibacterium sp.]|jgi:diguanylate cyclase (GGDEF)-like protein|uniref:bifunctional diguanylate cyclase/phosphodiesterase n=1 Tax=Undibacterium sp. TaxID=1914977 RepID=UPI002BDAC2E1|nr:EAL domain-containing protein [Undibacterium sp.]HTD03319.1 EAL domain-containing protein [Undibacterium sp.]
MGQARGLTFFNIKAIPAALLTALVCLSVTAWLSWLSLQVTRENAQRRLQESVFQHHASLQNELEHEVSRLESFVSLYHISPDFDRYTFHSFAKIENQPWLAAKLFSKRVSPRDMPQFEALVRTDTSVDVRGYPGFHILDKVPGQDALVALYLEPRQKLQGAHGLNLEKWFQEGSKRLRDSGHASSFVLNNTHPLLRGNNIVISMPVYETGLPIRTEAQRRIAFSGAFTTVISIDKLLPSLFNGSNLQLKQIQVFGSDLETRPVTVTLAGNKPAATGSSATQTTSFALPLTVPGQKWTVRYEMLSSDGLAETDAIWFILFIGLLLTAFATGFVYVTVRTGKIAHRLAKDMTRALHHSEGSLLETQRLAKMGSFQLTPSHQISAQTGNILELFGLPATQKIDYFTQILASMEAEDAIIFGDIVAAAFETSLHTHLIVQISAQMPSWLNLIIDSSGAETGFTLRVIAMDVTEKYLSEQKIKQLAYQDALTGLANRASLRIATEQALSGSRAQKSKLALLFLDLDRFKFINDSVGHDVGDQVLIEIALRLRSAVKTRDFIARLGGDEFVILVDELDNDKDIRAIANRILSLVCAPMQLGQHTYYLTTSIGVAIANGGEPDADVLMKQADIAMYHSKEKGKNKYTIFSTDIAEVLEKQTSLERELRVAITEGQLVPYFQPQFRVSTHRLCGVETLLRWKHSKRGMLPAKDFIKVAEESGLIIQIGNQVLIDVCRTIATWNLPDDFVVGVNVSSLQFFQAGFVDFVIATINDAGIDPRRLEIEVTETMIMQDTEIAKTCLEQLNAYGVGISIDDFGTGYASLTYLRDFPVQRIKIDQRFVKGHTNNSKDQAIVKAISTLGHDFGMQVIAEGVETDEQLASLGLIGCDMYQGWLRSTALPASAIEELLPQHENAEA